MSYRLKGAKVILEGDSNIIVPQSLPGSPVDGQICIDSADLKYKVWNATLGRWVILGDAEDVVFDNGSNGFTADNVQAAIEEAKQNAEGFPRAGLRASMNGSVSNGNWIGPNELLPNTPLLTLPVNTKLNEISWANANANVSFDLQFRTVSKTGTIFYTMTVTSPNAGSGYVSGLNYTFAAGTTIWCQYVDTGTNVSDFDLVLWISRIP